MVKIAFYFNDYKELNETGTFVAFDQIKKQYDLLNNNKIDFCCIFESHISNYNKQPNLKYYSLGQELEQSLKKNKVKTSTIRFRIGSYIQKFLHFFYLNINLVHPDPTSDYEGYLKLKTRVFEELITKENIDLIVYNHYFYFPSLNVPYILIAWDFAHRNIIGHLEFLNQYDWREKIFKKALDKAYRVITCSNAGKNELIKYGSVPDDRISIIPFSHPIIPTQQFLGEFPNEIKRPYIFLPASFWAHKNHITLLKAFKILIDEKNLEIQLVLAGPDKGNRKYIEEQVGKLGIIDYVIFLGFVERSLIWELYRNAEMLVFPTLLGPNNLPPLESLSVGCPAVISGIEGHRQQFEDSVLYFEPFDEKDLASQISILLNNDELKMKLLKNAKKLLSENKPEAYLNKMIPIFEEFKIHLSTYKS